MLIDVIHIIFSIASIICCIVCVKRCLKLKHEADDYHDRWLEAIDTLAKVADRWNETIDLCNDIVALNKELNSELKTRTEKLKENNNVED